MGMPGAFYTPERAGESGANYLKTALLGTTWVVSVAIGLRLLFSYEHTPGEIDDVPLAWPAGSNLSAASDRATLVMLAHPRCPCTQASISELARIMAQVQGKISAYVLFLRPTTTDINWNDTILTRTAAAIPGVTIVTDVDGAEARRFGAGTSGHTLLFNKDGLLVFSGGITASRGHAGENAGENAILSLIRNGKAAHDRTLVFGCALRDRHLREDSCLK